ncbi:MAG TPA: inositol monophosphatase family protein [Herpetosiphonaceae bacterium]
MTEREYMEQWAREAGALALAAFKDAAAAPPRRKADSSWVTEVDEEVERMLRARIAAVYPGDRVMGEEQGGVGTTQGRMWALDPIDGTGSFVKRLPVWGVSLGLMIDGAVRAGCFYLPVTDECYLAGLDGPATLNGRPIKANNDRAIESQSWMAVPSNAHRRYRIDFPGKTRSLGSTAANICYVAGGGAVAALVGASSIWDIVGALAVLERAGGVLRGVSGAELDWAPLLAGKAASEPLLAAGADTFDAIRQLIAVR